MSIGTRNKISVAFSMSGLTDIVFLLLIFFILLSTLIKPFGRPVDLPNDDTNYNPEKATVSVSIDRELNYWVGDKQVDPINIEQELLTYFQGTELRNAILYVDESVPTGFTINMLALAGKNDIEMVIATESE